MRLDITPTDYEKIKEQLAKKQKKLDALGLGLGDAMSRTGSFPASSPEYAAIHLEMKNEQNSIDYLKSVLSKYTVVPPEKINNKYIGIYSRVTLENSETGEHICYYICLEELGRNGDDGCLLATPESPVGRALLGHKLGDMITIALPSRTKVYKVVEHEKSC